MMTHADQEYAFKREIAKVLMRFGAEFDLPSWRAQRVLCQFVDVLVEDEVEATIAERGHA